MAVFIADLRSPEPPVVARRKHSLFNQIGNTLLDVRAHRFIGGEHESSLICGVLAPASRIAANGALNFAKIGLNAGLIRADLRNCKHCCGNSLDIGQNSELRFFNLTYQLSGEFELSEFPSDSGGGTISKFSRFHALRRVASEVTYVGRHALKFVISGINLNRACCAGPHSRQHCTHNAGDQSITVNTSNKGSLSAADSCGQCEGIRKMPPF